jgi:hypothetical protein
VGYLIETDGRGRVVLPGRRNERFLVTENEDGSLLLEPAVVLTAAEHRLLSNTVFGKKISEAAAEPADHIECDDL